MSNDVTLRTRAASLPLLGVFLVSAGTLILEINLTRIFCYAIWYHFAFIAISLALLGFGASGSVLAFRYKYPSIRADQILLWSPIFAAVSAMAMTYLISAVPFNPFDAGKDPTELQIGVLYLLAVAAPFFFTGCTIACFLDLYSSDSGRVYFANLLGSGAGCLSYPLIINWLGAPLVLALACVLFSFAACTFAIRKRALVVTAAALVSLFAYVQAGVVEFTPCNNKNAAEFVRIGGRSIWSKWHSVFRTDVYDFPSGVTRGSSYGTLGVSARYQGERPEVRYVSHDADACAVMINAPEGPENLGIFLGHQLGFAYYMRPGANVYMGGVGGGVDVMAALSNGAKRIDGVELDPYTVLVVTDLYSDYVGRIGERENVSIRAGEARSTLRASGDLYDVIQFTAVDTITAMATGTYMLSEGYLYTVNAFHEYLDRLAPDGIVSFASTDMPGPVGMFMPRLCAVVANALEERGQKPAECTILLRSSDEQTQRVGMPLYSLLIKNSPFSDDDLGRAREFADSNGFVLVHQAGAGTDTASSKILSYSSAERAAFVDAQQLDFSPVTDDRPFFMNFYRWKSLFGQITIDPRYTAMTGNLVLLGALCFSAIGALVLIMIPSALAYRGLGSKGRVPVWAILYFAGIGFGFMFIQMAAIQHLVLFLGYPTYSLTVTLAGMLTFAGIGSLISQRVPLSSTRAVLILYSALMLCVLLYALFGHGVLLSMSALSLPARIAIALLSLAPISCILGFYFPLGIRALSRSNPEAVPLAWAANASCSVVGTIIALIVATVAGFRVVFIIALAFYLVATVMRMRGQSLVRDAAK